MRKKQIGIRFGLAALIILTALIWTALASAEERPVNPKQAKVWELERLAREKPEGGLVPKGGKPVSLSCRTSPTLGGTGTWTVSYNTGAYGAVRDVIYCLEMKDYSSEYTTTYYIEKSGAPGTISSCKIVSGGSYRMAIYARFGNMTGYYYDTYTFTIRDDASHTSLTEKVAQVAASCRASTTWQTALNLYDWLVEHVYYDLNYQYYGADMILRGYGVCDGYSKAYCMLCKQAGITVSRVSGDAGGAHAWNAIKLDGQWYYVDPTWDDPAGQKTAKSGSEGHQYFCVNSRILSLDHTDDRKDFTGSCTSLDANYYIHTGEWTGWGGKYNWIYGQPFQVITYKDQIQDSLNSGVYSCTLDQETVWLPEGHGDSELWRKIIVAYGLARTTFTLSDGGPVRVSVSEAASGWPVTVRLSGWALQETGTLKLPAGTLDVPVSAFEKCAATTVKVSGRCRTVGSRAFADSAVRTVHIPNSVTYIAPDAFAGCARIIFRTNNQTAVSYANSHDFLVLAP